MDITQEELIGELAAFYRRESVQPGDVTVKDLARISGKSENTIRMNLAHGRVPAGWMALKAFSPDASGEIWVLRRL